MRLNRFLSQCGLGSRRGCEQIIRDGRVVINGHTIRELGTLVGPDDKITVDGRPVRSETPIVIALHKPKGYLCTRSDERDRMTIYDLLPRQHQSLHHVGRLDKESEGLLLLTNRGELSHHLIHPSQGAEKEYEVIVDKPLDQTIMAKLVKGMMTEEGHAKAERAWMITDYRCHVVLKQGLKRQIRLMFYQLGFEVERLTRTRIGWLELKGLPKGGWKQLTEAEVQRFFTQAGTTGREKPATVRRSTQPKQQDSFEEESALPAPTRRLRGRNAPKHGGKSPAGPRPASPRSGPGSRRRAPATYRDEPPERPERRPRGSKGKPSRPQSRSHPALDRESPRPARPRSTRSDGECPSGPPRPSSSRPPRGGTKGGPRGRRRSPPPGR